MIHPIKVSYLCVFWLLSFEDTEMSDFIDDEFVPLSFDQVI